jgi:release factor glutamine methyltransferase
MRSGVGYLSAQDSLLLRRNLVSVSGGACLEIGAGNGSNLKDLSGRFRILVGTDLVLSAHLRSATELDLSVVITDRATTFRDSVFDLVILNPPYLPSSELQDVATDGGTGGMDVPLLFLREAVRVVKADGKILVVLSSDSDLRRLAALQKQGVRFRVIDSESLFYEKLFVFELRKEEHGD